MNKEQFIRRVRRYARRNDLDCHFYPAWGKGSHGRLFVGERFTTVQDGELTPPMVSTMLRQLGINRREF